MRVTPASMSFADVSSRSRTINHTGKPTMDTRATRGWSECVRVCVHGSTGWRYHTLLEQMRNRGSR